VPYALGVPWQAIPFSAGQRPLLALELAADAWQQIKWRDGSNTPLSLRFASWRVRPARDDAKRGEPAPEEWLLIEWPEGAAEPDHYWLSTVRRFRSRRHRRIIGCCTGRGIGGRQRRTMPIPGRRPDLVPSLARRDMARRGPQHPSAGAGLRGLGVASTAAAREAGPRTNLVHNERGEAAGTLIQHGGRCLHRLGGLAPIVIGGDDAGVRLARCSVPHVAPDGEVSPVAGVDFADGRIVRDVTRHPSC
jgi:hypothetical protein